MFKFIFEMYLYIHISHIAIQILNQYLGGVAFHHRALWKSAPKDGAVRKKTWRLSFAESMFWPPPELKRLILWQCVCQQLIHTQKKNFSWKWLWNKVIKLSWAKIVWLRLHVWVITRCVKKSSAQNPRNQEHLLGTVNLNF